MDYESIYFADASALVKLFIDERGSQELREFLTREGIIYTSSLCLGEAFGVMKRKRFKEETLTQEQYEGVIHRLGSYVKSHCIKLDDHPDVTNPHVFFEVTEVCKKHELDICDALRIVWARQSKIDGATLITADRRLAKAARRENIWDCEREPEPAL